MRIFIVVVLLGFSCISHAQDTFIKSYDFFDEVNEATPRDMFVIDDEVHILGIGDCESSKCLHYYVLNFDGEVIRTKRFPNIYPGLYSAQQDSSIYVSGYDIGSDTVYYERYSLFKLDLNGQLIDRTAYDQYANDNQSDYDIDIYIPRGVLVNEDKIVIYGDTRETDQVNDFFKRGLVMYYNKDLSLDTLFFINPRYRNMEMWNGDVDSKGNFVFLFDYDEIVNGEDIDYRTIAKYDSEAKLLFRYEPPVLHQDTEAFISMEILDDDKIVYQLETGASPADRSNDLFAIDSFGNTLWRQQSDFDRVQVGTADFKIGNKNTFSISASYDITFSPRGDI